MHGMLEVVFFGVRGENVLTMCALTRAVSPKALGMDKSDELAQEAVKLLESATKIRDFRNDALETLTTLVQLARSGSDDISLHRISDAVSAARDAGVAVRVRMVFLKINIAVADLMLLFRRGSPGKPRSLDGCS